MEQYVTIKTILDRLLRHPLMSDISFESVIDYTIDFMNIAGVPDMFLNKETTIDLIDYKASLPLDWVETIQITYKGKPLVSATSTFMPDKEDFYTFKIQNNIIFTSIENGNLNISYKAIPIDTEGYPMIPSDISFLKALENYIKVQYFTILSDLGKIQPSVLQHTEQEYCWAVGGMKTDMLKVDISKMEAITNTWSTLLFRQREFDKQFRDNANPQIIKIH